MKTMYSIMKKILISHPYLVIMASIFYFFSSFMFNQVHIGYMGDLYIYIEIAQNMFNDGILYKDAIDTKNMGFFFFFYYLIYLPYATLFSTTQFLFIWIAVFMQVWYFLLSILIYNILYPLYGTWKSLCAVVVAHIFVSYSPHMTFLNQPQIAIMFHLLLIYAIMKTYHRQNYWDYLLYGGILGLCFSFASPYAYLVLLIPILAFKNFLKERNFIKVILQGLVAFCGFVIVLVPFFWYFYSNDALTDWWQWNFIFATGVYSSRLSTFTQNRDISFLMKIIMGLVSMLARSIVIGSKSIDSITSHIILYTTIIAWSIIGWQKFIKKSVSFSKVEFFLFLSSSLCIISRIGLIRWYTSYNIYLIPFIALQFPMVIRILSTYTPKLFKVYKTILILGAIISIIYVPIRFTWAIKITYVPKLVVLTKLNPNKTPTIMLSQWTGFTYSTQWKHLYYNFYHFLDTSFQEKVYSLQPEVLMIRADTFKDFLNQDNQFMKFLEKYYQLIQLDNISFIPENTDSIGSKNIFIKKDKIASWNLTNIN